MESIEILKNVARFVGEEQHVEALERLVHVANCLSLDEGVLDGTGVALPARAHQLGEGGEQAFNANAADVHELARDQRLSHRSRISDEVQNGREWGGCDGCRPTAQMKLNKQAHLCPIWCTQRQRARPSCRRTVENGRGRNGVDLQDGAYVVEPIALFFPSLPA